MPSQQELYALHVSVLPVEVIILGGTQGKLSLQVPPPSFLSMHHGI